MFANHMSVDHEKDWRTLCEAVVRETDPDRFMALVIELNNALDERERRRDGILHEEPTRVPRSSQRPRGLVVTRPGTQIETSLKEADGLWP